MNGNVAERLAHIAGKSTMRLTHHGRRSGKPYQVTIWFMAEGEVVYLVTAAVGNYAKHLTIRFCPAVRAFERSSLPSAVLVEIQ